MPARVYHPRIAGACRPADRGKAKNKSIACKNCNTGLSRLETVCIKAGTKYVCRAKARPCKIVD